jgi:hypothetical protein
MGGVPVCRGRADETARKTGRLHGLAVGAIDETGQVKAAARTVGVKRQ